MRLPKAPDLSSPKRFTAAILVTGLAVCTLLLTRLGPGVGATLGDTDDATRLVMVRELIHGRPWFDPLFTRFQPPEGVWMHWSRLLDGGIAAMLQGFGLFFPPAQAERLTRLYWPMLWVMGGVAAVFGAVRRLASPPEGVDRTAVNYALVAAAVLCLLDTSIYYDQFRPGRIDHHDVQIVMCLVAATGVMQGGRRVWSAVMAGVATGLGLAIGLEALVFQAALAAAMALRFLAASPGHVRDEGRRARAYGFALAATTAAAFLAQTPPARWGIPACDALAVNLLAGAVAGGLALALAATLTDRRAWPWRLLALGLAGGAALAVYVGLDPHCVRGPFADVDARIHPFWLDHVQEMRPLTVLLKSEKGSAFVVLSFMVAGVIAWAGLGLSRTHRRDPAWLIQGLMIALSIAMAFTAMRARAYIEWFSLAPIAVATAWLGCKLSSTGPLIGAGLIAGALSPATLIGLATLITPLVVHPKKAGAAGAGPDHCFEAFAYGDLAKLPPGLVVSEVDLGPFVVAHTPSSAMSAPYHRMTIGLLRARSVVSARADDPGPDGAEARARAMGTTYILECRAHARHADRAGLGPDKLQWRLDHGQPPGWLQPLSPKGAPLEIYALRPPVVKPGV